MACSVCKKDQHSLRESANCDWTKNHKGKATDTRKPVNARKDK